MSLKDRLVVGAYFYGKKEKVKDLAELAKKLLQGLEGITPWTQPFDVSGNTKKLSYLPIDEGLSNFNETLLQIWQASDSVYYDEAGNRTLDFSENHFVKHNLRTSFSNYIQCKNEASRVSIGMGMGEDHEGKASKNIPNNVVISIPNYSSGQINEKWAQREVIENAMRYLIEMLTPYHCAAFSSNNSLNDFNGYIPKYKFNWLSYVNVKEVCELLSDNMFAQEYNDGLWFDFGKNVMTVEDPSTREAAKEIYRQLIEAKLDLVKS